MRKLFGVMKPPREAQQEERRRLDMPRATGTGFQLTGAEYERHLDVIIIKLAETPRALDALLFVLQKILANPRNLSNRQINTSKPVFGRTLGTNLTWSVRFIEAIGFSKAPTSIYYNLTKRMFNLDKLSLAASKLERAQNSETYVLGKDKIQFARETEGLLADGTQKENLVKMELMANVPPEPRKGAGGNTKVRVYFGEADIQRFFASDNTLQSVLDWVCSSLHSSLLERLRSGEFELIDRTTYPPKQILILPLQEEQQDDSSELDLLGLLEDNSAQHRTEQKTLQELGLWPSGEVEIQKTGLLERERALLGIFK